MKRKNQLWKSFHKMMKSGRLNKVVRMFNEKNKTHKTPSRESVVQQQ